MRLDGSLTASEVREAFEYNPDTGVIRWRHWAGRRAPAGKVAGTKKGRGSIEIKFRGRRYQASRLAWLYVTGGWPSHEIDHRDCNPGNNAWANLREATDNQNLANKPVQSNNKLGLKGVHAHTGRRGRVTYKAQISVNRRVIYLGRFSNKEDARLAYLAASRKYHGEFAHD